MLTPSFKETQARIQTLYQQKEYQAAYEMATRLVEQHPEQHLLFQYWRMSTAARLGNHQQALDILASELKQGNWYADFLLRKNPSYQSLQGIPEFGHLLQINQELRQHEFQQIFPLLTIRPQGGCQSSANPCPLLIALHDHASTAQADIENWQPAAMAGWIVAVPQSSQAMWRGAYIWDDLQVTLAEIQKHYQQLTGTYAVDPSQVILGGRNTGALAALHLALSEALPATGFLILATAAAFQDGVLNWEAPIADYQAREANRSVRGYAILVGYDDEKAIETLQLAMEAFIQAGIPAAFEIIPEFDKPNSPEYELAFQNALEFLQESS